MYKLKINGYNAEFNGITKGTITIDGNVYEWDNSPQDIDYSMNYDFSNEENVTAFQNAPVWSGYTGEKAIYKRQDTQQMSWDTDSIKISPTGVRYGLYWALPARQATGKVTEEFQLWYDFPEMSSKQTIGTIFHTHGSKNGQVDGCRLNYIYDPSISEDKFYWTWRKYTTSSQYTDLVITTSSERINFKIEYDFDDTKTIKIYINNTLYYTDKTTIEARGLTSLEFINNSINNNSSVKDNVTEYVYKVSVN